MVNACATALSYGVFGVEPYQVSVEIDVVVAKSADQKPVFNIVGLPEGAVRESRERVRSAITNSDLWFPVGRITANLAPADIRKEGAAFDLPLAMGVLAAASMLPPEIFEEYAMVGELGLDGRVRPVRGALPLALGARKDGLKGLIVPLENAAEASVV